MFFMEEEASFAFAVRRQRTERGWSQGELAERLHMLGHENFHTTTISRIEKNERPVRLGEAYAIAEAFGVPLRELLPRDRAVHTAFQQLEALVRDSETRLFRLNSELQFRQTAAALLSEALEAARRLREIPEGGHQKLSESQIADLESVARVADNLSIPFEQVAEEFMDGVPLAKDVGIHDGHRRWEDDYAPADNEVEAALKWVRFLREDYEPDA